MRTLLPPLLCVALAAQQPDSNPSRPTLGSISGRVVDSMLEPVVQASIEVQSWPGGAVLGTTKSDGSGWFVAPRVPLDGKTVIVFATAPGYTKARAVPDLRPSSHEADGLTLKLYAAGTITGTVTDDHDKPVAGAALIAAIDNGDISSERAVATSDAAGKFTIEHALFGDLTLRAHKPGFLMHEERLELRDTAAVAVRMTPGEGASVRLRVDGLAAPIDREKIHLYLTEMRAGSGQYLPLTVERPALDEHGRVTLTGLVPGDYYVQADSAAIGMKPYNNSLKLRAGEQAEAVFTATYPRRLRLTGSLLDREGKPLAGRNLAVWRERGMDLSERCTTADDGTFELFHTVPIGQTLRLYLDDARLILDGKDGRFQFAELTSEAEQQSRLVASRSASLRGKVVDPEGNAVAGTTVELTHPIDPDSPQRWALRWVTTGRDGTFVLRNLRATEQDLWLEVAEPRGEAKLTGLRLAEGEALDKIVIKLRPAAAIRGSARDALGKPMVGARIELRAVDREHDQASSEETLTDREGRYLFAGLSAGRYRVAVMQGARGNVRTSQLVDVEAREQKAKIDFTVK